MQTVGSLDRFAQMLKRNFVVAFVVLQLSQEHFLTDAQGLQRRIIEELPGRTDPPQ
jgi:hypothetical protein